jgi:hypothetical protein
MHSMVIYAIAEKQKQRQGERAWAKRKACNYGPTRVIDIFTVVTPEKMGAVVAKAAADVAITYLHLRNPLLFSGLLLVFYASELGGHRTKRNISRRIEEASLKLRTVSSGVAAKNKDKLNYLWRRRRRGRLTRA